RRMGRTRRRRPSATGGRWPPVCRRAWRGARAWGGASRAASAARASASPCPPPQRPRGSSPPPRARRARRGPPPRAARGRLAAAAREKGAESSSETPRGVADDVIVERAKQADLIVLGRDGEHAGFRTALIGSTADGVLRKTSKPVMVVPQSAELAGPVLLA